MSHTPGPWFKSTTKCGGWICASSLQVPLAEVLNLHDITHDDQDDANFNLIAAAPELLEALEAFELWETRYMTYDSVTRGLSPILEQARAAIAKAKGE